MLFHGLHSLLSLSLFSSTFCRTFNIRSGTVVQKTAYPFVADASLHVWHNQSAGGSHGVWGTEGIWQLQSQKVTDFFSGAGTATKGTTEGHLDDVFLARLWYEPFLPTHTAEAFS